MCAVQVYNPGVQSMCTVQVCSTCVKARCIVHVYSPGVQSRCTVQLCRYGVHPRYTVLEADGSAHGVLFLNSNAQEVTNYRIIH